jgi:hypothetical protein
MPPYFEEPPSPGKNFTMPWTAKLGNVDLQGEMFTIHATDGVRIISQGFRATATDETIKARAREFVARLAAADKVVPDGKLTLTENAVIDLTPPAPVTPPAPTQAEIDRAQWATRWNNLRSLLNLSDAGLIQPADARITTLRATLISTWDNSYVDIARR